MKEEGLTLGSLHLQARLIAEEADEVSHAVDYITWALEERPEYLETAKEDLLKEVADLTYVCYQLCAAFGWDLQVAMNRVHESNMSKLDDNGEPIFREDGKVLKSNNYKPPILSDLV